MADHLQETAVAGLALAIESEELYEQLAEEMRTFLETTVGVGLTAQVLPGNRLRPHHGAQTFATFLISEHVASLTLDEISALASIFIVAMRRVEERWDAGS